MTDTVVIGVSLAGSLLMANLFGVESSNIAFYLIVGLMVSGYKLLTAKERQMHAITATVILGAVSSIVIAPAVELRLGYKPFDVAFILIVIVLLGEVGIYFLFEKLFGMNLVRKVKEKEKDLTKK